MIHLDTSFLIGALTRGSREDTRLREWIAANEPLGMSTVAWAEFLCGPVDETALSVALVVVGRQSRFTEEMATIAARLFNGSGRRRGTMVDCMIAATALAEEAAVATSNPDDFMRFEAFGLALA
ncbi:MAG: PIN domain-containing protein [Thiotrichales bacterium]|nr:PIN domain-containing protein [Thiotrichales bacterium]